MSEELSLSFIDVLRVFRGCVDAQASRSYIGLLSIEAYAFQMQ